MANVLVNFLFAGSSASLVNSARQAIGALTGVQQRVSTLSVGSVGAVAGLGLLAAGLFRLTNSAIRTSAEFQRLSTSFVSTLAAPLLDVTKGASLTEDQLNTLRVESTRIFTEAQRAAIDTVATTKEYVTVLQSALAVGQNVGLNQLQIETITRRMVQAAGAFGIEFEKVGSSIAQILTGSVRVTNQLGRNLGLTTAEARKQLRLSIQQGQLFEFLEVKTRQFAAVAKEVENNFINVGSAIADIFQVGGTAALAPFFKFLNEQLIKLRDTFIGSGSQFFTPALQNIVSSIQQFFKDIIPSLRVLFNEIGQLFGAIGDRTSGATTFAKVFLAALTAVVRLLREIASLTPFGSFIIAAGLVSLVGGRLIRMFVSLRASIIAARAAVTTLNVGFVSSTTAALRFLGVVGFIVAGVALLVDIFDQLGGSTDSAARRLEKLDASLEKFKETQDRFIQDTNLRLLIAEYKELTSTADKTYEQQVRLAEITDKLNKAFGEVPTKGPFIEAQAQLNQQLADRIDQLTQLQGSIAILLQGAPTPPLEADQSSLESFANANARFEAAKKTFEELGTRFIPNFSTALADNREELQKWFDRLDQLGDEARTSLSELGLLTLGFDDLIEFIIDAKNSTQDYAEVVRTKLAPAQGAIITLLLEEAQGNRAVAKARAEAALQRVRDTIRQLQDQKLINDGIIAQIELVGKLDIVSTLAADSLAGALLKPKSAAAAEQRGVADVDRRLQLALEAQAQLQNAIAKFSIAPRTAEGGGGRTGRDRDELRDFLAEIDRQLGLIRKTADGIEKESTRIIDSRRKLIQDLADSGVIAFEDAFAMEELLTQRSEKLSTDLANIQLDLIRDADRLAKAVAKRTEEASKRPRGKTRPGGDTRDREVEGLIKLTTTEIEILNKLNEGALQIEETRTEALDRQIKARIELRQAEQEKIRAAASSQAATLSAAQEALAEFGLISQNALIRGKIAQSQAALERERQSILQQLFPLIDPSSREELRKAISDVAGILGTGNLANAAADLGLRIQRAGGDPSSLEKLRQFVRDSATDEGFIHQLIAERNSTLGRLDIITDRLGRAKDQLKAFNEEASKTGKKPDEAARDAIIKTIAALTKELDSANTPEEIEARKKKVEALTKAILLLNQLGVSDVKTKQLQQELDENKAKSDQQKIADEITLLNLDLQRIKIAQDFVDFDLQRLDILESIVETQREFGIITDIQFRRQSGDILRQQIQLLQDRRKLLQEQLNRSTSSGASDSPQIVQQRLGIQNEINQLTPQLFELQNRLFELHSPLVALKGAFAEIGEAVGSLPEPFNKLKGVFTGLESLADALIGKSRPKPDENILKASEVMDGAGKLFDRAALKFALAVDKLLGGGAPDTATGTAAGALGGIAGDSGVQAAKKGATNAIAVKAAAIIGAAGSAIAGVLGGIANKDVGQAIAGFGNLAALIPVAGPFIKAGLEIVGGIVSFFGARAREKTKEMAEAITKGIAELREAISSGAVGLGQGIRELEARLVSARQQLSGRKGGKDELKQIEEDTQAELKRLRAQAADLQDNFRDQLELLRQPASLRDLITQITAINAKAKEFIKSFEDPADALAAVEDAQEFIRRSIAEIKDAIEKTLKDLQDNLKEATEDFAKDQRSILLEGRIDPAVSIAESKRQRLVELERAFQREKATIEESIAAERTKLAFVESREKLEEKIARLAERGAAALGNAADRLSSAAAAMERAFSQIGSFPFGQAATAGGSVTLNLRVNDQPVATETVGIDSVRHIELAGLISPSRGSRFNPVIR